MKILVLEDYCPQIEALSHALVAQGHQVVLTDNTSYAQAFCRLTPPDLLIAALFPQGETDETESGLSVVMAAQFHNPDLATILLSQSALFSHGELFAMLQSLRCVLPRPAPLEDLLGIVEYTLRPKRSGVRPAAEPTACTGCTRRGKVACAVCYHAEVPLRKSA